MLKCQTDNDYQGNENPIKELEVGLCIGLILQAGHEFQGGHKGHGRRAVAPHQKLKTQRP